jgi:uncharacterized protein involved in exopolysaccharide biosynthesis
VLAARNQYVNSDPMIQELTRRIIALEQELILEKQTLAPENPTIGQQQEILETFRSRLDKKRTEIGLEFDKVVSEQRMVASDQQKVAMDRADKTRKEKLRERRLEMQAAIERIKANESRLNEILKEQDAQARQVGRRSLDIQELQFQQDLDREMYDTVSRRIKELEMQGKREPRISVDAWATKERYEDKRIKFTAAAAFGALACGCLAKDPGRGGSASPPAGHWDRHGFECRKARSCGGAAHRRLPDDPYQPRALWQRRDPTTSGCDQSRHPGGQDDLRGQPGHQPGPIRQAGPPDRR